MKPDVVEQEAILRVADAVGGLIEFWGFKRNMGRMWTVLYLAPGPMSAADLCTQLSLSTGAVSMTLSELSRWGVVKKAWVPGERRDYYEPETSIWKMVSGVFRQRELRQVRAAIEVFEQAIAALDKVEASARGEAVARLRFAGNRIRGLLSLAQIGDNLLTSILEGKSVDSSILSGFSLGSED